jgi:hypothetical protein
MMMIAVVVSSDVSRAGCSPMSAGTSGEARVRLRRFAVTTAGLGHKHEDEVLVGVVLA